MKERPIPIMRQKQMKKEMKKKLIQMMKMNQ